jgi:chromosome segregation ATPase
MAFTDLVSSSRGPGVIGTFIAFIVLGGFALLYFLVFDESMQGGQKTIQSVIKEQEAAIASRKTQIESFRVKEESAKQRETIAKEVRSATRKLDGENARKAELAQQVAAGQAAVKELGEKWEAYKDQYRAQVWREAQGKELKEFKTVSGKVYTDAKVLGVDHTGMRLMVFSGPITVPSQELPDDLRELYQLSEEKKKAILAAESTATAAHEDNVEVAKRQERIATLTNSINEKDAAKTGAEARLKSAVNAGATHQYEIARQENAIAAERSKAISRAPQMQQQLEQMKKKAEETRNSIPKLQGDIRTMEDEITKMNGEIQTLTQEITKIRTDARAKAAPANP